MTLCLNCRNPKSGGIRTLTDFLTRLLEAIYSVVQNHGWAIVVFTILIRVVLLPLDIKSRKGMRKQSKIQPELNRLQKKYANDRAKLQQKQSELMRKEGYNPLSGCLPILIQMPILFAMFAAMRSIAERQTIGQVFTYLSGGTPTYEGWLWVKNLWAADSLFASVAPNLQQLQMIGKEVWANAYAALDPAMQASVLQNIQTLVPEFSGALDFLTNDGFKLAIPAIQAGLQATPAYQAVLATVPGWANINFLLFQVSVFVQHNGLLLLPILAGATQVLMTKLSPMPQPQAQTAQEGQPQQPGMGNFMKYFFPAFSVYICLSSNAGFALYWVVSNVIASASNFAIARYFDNKDKREKQQEGVNTVQ